MSFPGNPSRRSAWLLLAGLIWPTLQGCAPARGVGDMGIVIERASGSVAVVENSHMNVLARVEGLGDLSHASLVYSRDGRYAFIFGRDGGLSKVDLLSGQLVGRVIQGGNSIGGSVSQDGRLVAVANYQPGGVKIFATDTLELLADIPAVDAKGKTSKVVGVADAPGQKFVYSLFDSDEIWVADVSQPTTPRITKYTNVGSKPYDALISPDGRHYIAGLFGEDGFALLDLWHPEQGVKRILNNYGRGEKRTAVHKMPHLRGWAMAGNLAFLPAMGRHEVLIVDRESWQEVGRVPVIGQPVFVMAQPDGRQIWVNFAHPDNGNVQVIDVPSRKLIKTLTPGPGVMHMEFTPRGEHLWLSVRDADRVDVYHTGTFERLATLPALKPSGIFFTNRAHKIGL
ncbi:MAG: protein nirF [Magnetococcales bacterium]|nr:protein nirF [Magnetococcales bacterium]